MTLDLVEELATRGRRPDLLGPARGAFAVTADLDGYLQGYDACARLLVTEDDFAQAVTEHLVRLAAQHVVFTELFWSPMVHLDDGVSYETQVAGIAAGVERSGTGVDCRLVPAIDRSRPVADAEHLLDLVLRHRHDRVVGLGLDYDELLGPAERFVPTFRRARSVGLGATSHAGETAGVDSIRASIELLGCRRIDHGYAVMATPDDVEWARTTGVGFTVSSRAARLLVDWGVDVPGAPAEMRAAGLTVSPATDAPAHFGTSLSEELALLTSGTAEARELMVASVDLAMLDDADVRDLRRRLGRGPTSPPS